MLTVSLRAERILFKWKEFVFSDVRETFFFFFKATFVRIYYDEKTCK